jgi:hypothetical protein
VSGADGATRSASWRVTMKYDDESREWTGGAVQAITKPESLSREAPVGEKGKRQE